jgi:hypothetical protein
LVGRLHGVDITDKTTDECVFSNPESVISKDATKSKEFVRQIRAKPSTRRTVSLDLSKDKSHGQKNVWERRASFQFQLNDKIIDEIIPNLGHETLYNTKSGEPSSETINRNLQQRWTEPTVDSVSEISAESDGSNSLSQSNKQDDELSVDFNYLFVNSRDLGTPNILCSRSLNNCSFER